MQRLSAYISLMVYQLHGNLIAGGDACAPGQCIVDLLAGGDACVPGQGIVDLLAGGDACVPKMPS